MADEPHPLIKKTELKKLRECLGVSDEEALRRAEHYIDVRADRNCFADMVVLKETNVQLRKKVDEMKAQLQVKEQYNNKLTEMVKIKSFKASMTAQKELRTERAARSQAEGRTLLLQQQLKDTLELLLREREASSRTVEGIIFHRSTLPSKSPGGNVATTAAAAGLALAASVFHWIDASNRPSVDAWAPTLVAAALSASVSAAALAHPKLPQRTNQASNTDPAVTQYLYAPPLDEIPRGQELLRRLRDREVEVANLRRELRLDTGPQRAAKRTIEKLHVACKEKSKQVECLQSELSDLRIAQATKLDAQQSRIENLRSMHIATLSELTRMKAFQDGLSTGFQRSLPVAIPGKDGKRDKELSDKPASLLANSSAETNSTDSGDEPYIEGHNTTGLVLPHAGM
ncbi:hypothetical protein DIPPA_00781 [Diplonema papillatum]|nr:hypothetical protein DIPPA_00781 [Diplonema papillatum]